MNRSIGTLVGIVAAGTVCWLLPLFRIVPLKQAKEAGAAAVFNPAQTAERLWNMQLLKSLDQAIPAETLLPAIHSNAAAAKAQFGRSVGVSESYTYFIAGTGRVLATNEDEILLAVTEGVTAPEISLQVGLLFGNAVRDGTGLLNVNDYPNSQDFNAISEALNHLVETRVQPRLRERAKVGATVRFVGCAEVNDEATDLKPLQLVPLSVSVE